MLFQGQAGGADQADFEIKPEDIGRDGKDHPGRSDEYAESQIYREHRL